MSHSHGRQETRNSRWQQRQREESRETNRNRLERHPQGEHSGQRYDRETENRWESDPGESYANPRQSNSEPYNYDEFDSRYDPRSRPDTWRYPHEGESSNREWVSGTGQPPYREDRPGRRRQEGDYYAGSPRAVQARHEPEFMSRLHPGEEQRGSRSWRGNENTSPDYRKSSGARPSFAGRGPQGYKRSDDRITEDINEEMTRDHDLDASNISVEVKGGEVVLKGSVSDRESKRRAEEIAESCSGVNDVQNQLRIKRETSSDSGRDSKDDKGDGKRSTKLAS